MEKICYGDYNVKGWTSFEEVNLCLKEDKEWRIHEYFKPKLQTFVKHNFVSRWQDKQFKASIVSFPKNTIVSIVEFVENYSFEVQMNI